MKVFLSFILFLVVQHSIASTTDINGLRVWSGPDETKAVLDLSSQVNYKLFQLQDPPRVVVDIDDTNIKKKFNLKDNPAIKKIRRGKKGKNTLRLVFDLKSDYKARSFLLKPAQQYGQLYLHRQSYGR
jgi:N-acetylmuramoyl-L-alanine amidase